MEQAPKQFMKVLQSIRAFVIPHALSLCGLVMFLLLAALHFYALPKMQDKTELFSPTEAERPVLFPVFEAKGPIVHAQIDYQPPQQTTFQIFGQGCVTRVMVNYDLVPFNHRQMCDFFGGMTVNLAPFLTPGRNLLTITMSRPDILQIGPVIFNPKHRMLSDWLAFCLAGTACLWVILFLRRYTGECLSGSLLAAGMLIYLYQFSQTTFMLYAHDMPGHLEYIATIANHSRLPKPYEGWQYYHPPLYYATEALLLVFLNWLGSFDTVSALQLFSLGCFMAFLIFAALTLRQIIRHPLAWYAALLLMIFYPSGIILAAQINSTLLFYAWCAGCQYFILRWLKTRNDRYMGLALTMLGLGFATRTNMIMLCPLLVLAILYQWRRRGWAAINLRSKAVLAGLFVLIAGISADFGRAAYYRYTEHRTDSFIVGNFAHPDGITDNSVGHFLLLDIHSYLEQPFLNLFSTSEYFWNALLKTSLFGEYVWQQAATAKVMNILLLGLILYAGSAFAAWKDIKKRLQLWFLAVVLLVPIAALMVNRWLYPIFASGDFRYIYPALVGLCGMFGMAVERYLSRKNYVLAGGGIMLAIVFATCSVLFFLGQP